ncbi:SRPBCC family protein [Paenibacillus farraposensis]|uniref:SRPBCC family protein n=1 Tax=Paenibacillus farraposensis TaxID=2807095 RepID=UPI003606E338
MHRSFKLKTFTMSFILLIIVLIGGVVFGANRFDDSQRAAIDVDRNAQVIVDLSIEIDAPLETVWRIQTGIDQWPAWQKNVSQARLSGPIAVGSAFQWETHGLSVVSTIREVDPMRRIVWGGLHKASRVSTYGPSLPPPKESSCIQLSLGTVHQ